MSNWRIDVSRLTDEWNNCLTVLEEHFDAEVQVVTVRETRGEEIDIPLPWQTTMKIQGNDAIFEGEVHPNVGYAMMQLPKKDVHYYLYVFVEFPHTTSDEDIMAIFDRYDSVNYSKQ